MLLGDNQAICRTKTLMIAKSRLERFAKDSRKVSPNALIYSYSNVAHQFKSDNGLIAAKRRNQNAKPKYISLILVLTLMRISLVRDTILLRSETPSGEIKMSVLTSLVVVVLGTYITIWFNDKVSRSDYLADDSIEPS